MSVTINDHTDEYLADLERAIANALEMVGSTCEGDAAMELENSPRRVDTGRLRGSITHEVNGHEAQIGTGVEYAIYVHEGTSRMAPNRFLTNAAEKNKATYRAIIEEALENG